LSHLYIKTSILPRQARDKHRENSKTTVFPGDAAAVIAAVELNLEATEPKPQRLPAGRGTAVVTHDRDGVAIAASDAAAVIAAAELDPEATEPAT